MRRIRTFSIHVVLLPNEKTDQYEAAFPQRTKPHPEAARQLSQRMNFELECERNLVGGKIPPATSRCFR